MPNGASLGMSFVLGDSLKQDEVEPLKGIHTAQCAYQEFVG